MAVIPATGLPVVSEEEASGDTAILYSEIKRTLQLPIVPNIVTALGHASGAVNVYWAAWRAMVEHLTLPEALTAMISYTIATASDCVYCSASHELSCRQLGVDEDTLAQLVEDLQNVSPLRVKAMMEFALKVAKYPQDIEFADYENLREQGISNEEIIEIVMIASMAVASDIIADSLKVEVDDLIAEALGRQS